MSASHSRNSAEEPEPRLHVRDNRRIDPETYEVREPQATAAPAAQGAQAPFADRDAAVDAEAVEDGAVAELTKSLAERTADLQRLQAEYINYKRRVDRDRDLARKVAIEGVLKDFLSVLDDVRSAREHEQLTGGFKAVADEVERVTAKYGLQTYGQAGDPFDPHIHEALLHAHADGIEGPTCVEILQPGYRIGDRILRPARVAVAEPDPDAPAAEPAREVTTAATSEDVDTASVDEPELDPEK